MPAWRLTPSMMPQTTVVAPPPTWAQEARTDLFSANQRHRDSRCCPKVRWSMSGDSYRLIRWVSDRVRVQEWSRIRVMQPQLVHWLWRQVRLLASHRRLPSASTSAEPFRPWMYPKTTDSHSTLRLAAACSAMRWLPFVAACSDPKRRCGRIRLRRRCWRWRQRREAVVALPSQADLVSAPLVAAGLQCLELTKDQKPADLATAPNLVAHPS